jgi:IS5 family transposase
MKAPLAQAAVGPNPTDRGKKGSKRHLLVDGRSVPWLPIVTGANVNDEAARRGAHLHHGQATHAATATRAKHLCANAGYRSAENRRIIERHGYIPHVVDRRQEANAQRCSPDKKARRWVVEVCHSWFNRLRKPLVR